MCWAGGEGKPRARSYLYASERESPRKWNGTIWALEWARPRDIATTGHLDMLTPGGLKFTDLTARPGDRQEYVAPRPRLDPAGGRVLRLYPNNS